MKNIYIFRKPICFFLFAFFVMNVGWGQISMSSTSNHTQNFNTLATSGTGNSWINNSTISNWFSQRTGTGTTYDASAGTGTTGTLYSFGTGTNSDRALGTIGSSNAAAGNFAHGVLLRNTSGSVITDIKISYTLEQWRNGGNTTPNTITFWYKVSSSSFSALNPNSNSGWTQVAGLSLSSPINTSTAAVLDGNAIANKVSISNVSIPSLSLANNDYIMLKWDDPDHTGSDHGLAIDDVTINWTVSSTSYSVTFDANSGSGTMSNQTASSSTALTTNAFTRTGYTFAGWNTAANGSGTSYANNANFPFIANTTLYAQWAANTLNVTYDLQGGAGISNGTTTTAASLSNPGSPTRSLYNFDGWFTASSGGAPVTFPYAHGQTSNFTLYAQWTLASSNNCPNGASISPTTDQEVCENGTLNLITTTPSYSGGTGTPTVQYQWYYNTTNSNTISGATAASGATSDIFTPPSTSSDVGTRYYFCVAYATDNNCAQTATTQSLASLAFKVTVNGTPSAPTGTTSQSYCTGNTVSQLSVTGSSVAWYSASSGGSALNTATALTTSNYYASQTLNGCESSNRLAVAATVNTIPAAPTGTAAQTFCSGNTVSNLNATGTAIKWYSASSGGSALNGTSALSSTSYYASQTLSGCESSNRLAVAATVNSISIPSNLVSSNANCSSFDLSWDAVICASGYKFDVSDSFSFSKSNVTYSEGFESTGSFPPSGWINSSWSISSTANDINSGTYAATASSSTGTLTTKLISNPTKISFYLGRTTNSTIKDLVIEVSTTSQTAGFTTVQTFNHSNVPSNTYQKYEVDLSSYSTFSSVYIRFRKASSTTSPWRLDDIDFYTLVPYFIPNYNDKSISSNSTSISSLSPNTKYYYRVRSTDGTNTSANSNIDSMTTPALVLTTDGIIAPFCFGTATMSSLTYTAANDNPNSYSIDWNATANTVGLNDQAATSFTSSTSGGTISSIAIPSNVVAGNYSGVMTITNAAGCSITKNVSLTINALPAITINASPSSAIVCSGSNVSLTASGASNYSWSGGISNGTSFAVSSPTSYTVTGTDANGCSATASKTVNYYPASSNVVLASSSVSGALEQCTESDGYTYYANPAFPGQYLFGIYKNGNSFTATVDITVDNVNKYKKNTSSNGANQEHASYIMSRYWNVNATGTIGTGVKVRFFVDPQDITDLQNARDNDYNTLKNTTNPSTLAVISGMEYFKTAGTTYSPTNWIGNKYSGTIVKLTQDAINTLNGQTYVELSGITSFSGGSIGAAFGPSSNGLFNTGGTVGLPVTWKDVKATVKEEGNLIQWTTSSEKNTSHFEVEYSYDAKNFFKAFNDIKAAVNSTTDKSYDFMHLEEYGELVYYRIKQVDLDGKVDYSKAVVAKHTSKLPEFHVSMYPVPLNVQDLTVRIQTVQKTDITITINDLLGRGVYTERVSPQGYTTDHKLSLGHLQNGTYHVTIDNGLHKSVQVLVVGK